MNKFYATKQRIKPASSYTKESSNRKESNYHDKPQEGYWRNKNGENYTWQENSRDYFNGRRHSNDKETNKTTDYILARQPMETTIQPTTIINKEKINNYADK